MQIFIDSANIEEISELASAGIIEGVTTNPSLLAKEAGRGRGYRDMLKEICNLVTGPVSAEVIGEKAGEMVEEAKDLVKIAENIIIKIPMTLEGMKAVGRLKEAGIATNVTLVFSPVQALMAAKAGATFVSPFVGRLDDAGHDGMTLVEDIISIFDNYDFDTMVITASVRNPLHVYRAAILGSDVATVPYKIITQLLKHPLTDIGMDRFKADWKTVVK